MIYADIMIREINYEKSLANLFPIGIQKCSKMEDPNLAVRFLLKMGNASMTAALGILNLLDEKHKGELLCSLVNAYGHEIQSAFHAFLQNDDLGRNIHIGDISMAHDSNGCLSLIGRDIQIDYKGLMKSNKIKQRVSEYTDKTMQKTVLGGVNRFSSIVSDGIGIVTEAAVGAVPKTTEKAALFVVNQKKNKDRLLKMAEQALNKKGLCVKLKDFILQQEPSLAIKDEVIIEDTTEKKRGLSAGLTEELLDAVVEYIKGMLKK